MHADAVTGYLETFGRLRKGKRWSTSTTTLRFVALTLGATGRDDPFAQVEKVAAQLRRKAGWTSPLRSEIRYVVAAMILRRDLDARQVHTRVIATREDFRAHRLPRRGLGPTLAALMLVLHESGGPVPESRLDRMAAVYRRWRQDHYWLTNSNDLPAAALHAGREDSVDSIVSDVERAYGKLRLAGYRRGDKLQLVSQLLAAYPRSVDTAVQRFCRVADALRRAGERVGTARYDEIAILALTRGDPGRMVARVLRFRDRLRAVKPRPAKDLALSLATGIALGEDAESAAKRSAGDLAALRAIQAILDAQQAAAIAAITAASAAATASGS